MPMPRTPLRPATREELQTIIEQEIAAHGNTCDLNHIDVSGVDDMDALFKDSPFNGDISKWQVGHVVWMNNMFEGCAFNGNISQWDVSRVRSFREMFHGGAFLGDISSWTLERTPEPLDRAPNPRRGNLLQSMFSPAQLAVHPYPSLYHWMVADLDGTALAPHLKDFHDNNRDLTHALASTLQGRATLMHAMWRQDRSMALSAKTAYAVSTAAFGTP